MGRPVAGGLNEVAYMWREMNDNWYRIQTNSPSLIRKLKKRTTAEICGRTLLGSSEYWVIFRLHYNKPKYAIQGFQRLVGRNKVKTADYGTKKAEMVYKLGSKTEAQVS